MNKNLFLVSVAFLVFLFVSLNFKANQVTGENNPSDPEKIKVYLLGTFHFAQTDSTYDVLDDNHQKSINELCEIIAKMRPDKVFVERQPEYEFQNKVDSLYQVYLKLDRPMRARNEIYQVGFRVARLLGHPRVYQCDHPGQYGRYYRAAREYAEEYGQTNILKAEKPGTVVRMDDIVNEDSLQHTLSLLEYIQWMNSPEVMRTSHASYIANYPLIGSSDYYNYNDDTTLIGAELVSDWYHRNIMIYTKMINQVVFGEDKAIFLLIGADHIPIIRNLFNAHPYFEVVDARDWLGN
jgi:hypothetical protein